MLLEAESLKFGEFLLDLKEKALLRNGDRLPINPKTFQLLVILIENHGHLVEKDRLMNTLWAESFVEEANLAFTVSLLRKTLGDDAQRPRFIETVPRRGYRFIAKVDRSIAEDTLNESSFVARSGNGVDKRSRFTGYLYAGLTILVLSCIAGGVWYVQKGNSGTDPPILAATFSVEKLSSDSKVTHAVISPDGKNVAYTSGLGNDKQSVWIRQLESSNNVQIIPQSDHFYYNLAFSPDGNFVYFVRGPRPSNLIQAEIYRISIFGGIATRIAEETQGWMSVSGDGTKISFVRCYYRDDEYCSLWIADAADGKNERKLASRPRPLRISANDISPDGRSIAFATGHSRTGGNQFALSQVDIETGVESELTDIRFYSIHRMLWLPDQASILVTAFQYPDTAFRIWRVSASTGEAIALTKDSEDYYGLSLDNEGRTLVTTQGRPDFHLNLYQTANFAEKRQISSDAATVAFAPNGRLIISSGSRGNHDLWSIDADGGGLRQLTNSPTNDLDGIVSPDGNAVFFTSNRTGETRLWRMNIDGSGQTQISNLDGGSPLGVSPDGNWLYYRSTLHETLFRIPTNGGEAELVFDKRRQFAVSRDVTLAAFANNDGDGRTLEVVSLADGRTLKSFKIDDEKSEIVELSWSGVGKTLYYITSNGDSDSNWLWMQRIDKVEPRKLADLGPEDIRNPWSFTVSPDERSFAVIQGSWKRDAVLIRGLK